MSVYTPGNAGGSHLEPPSTSTDDSPVAAWFHYESGDSAYELTSDKSKSMDAELVDWHHDQSVYELAITGSPYKQIDDGSGNIILSQSGTAIAILIDGGDGLTLQVSTDLTQTPAGAFYDGSNGDIIPVRFDDRRVRFAQIGTTIFSFEDAA